MGISRTLTALIFGQAIIYVVDSSDTERIGMSAEEFHAILDEEELKDALILVLCKQAGAVTLQ